MWAGIVGEVEDVTGDASLTRAKATGGETGMVKERGKGARGKATGLEE